LCRPTLALGRVGCPVVIEVAVGGTPFLVLFLE
jgi:hypothetical protein